MIDHRIGPTFEVAVLPSPEFEPLLDSQQAAELLRIHSKTLQRMARSGKLPAHRIGDLWRFRASELDAWLRSRMVSSDRHSCP